MKPTVRLTKPICRCGGWDNRGVPRDGPTLAAVVIVALIVVWLALRVFGVWQ